MKDLDALPGQISKEVIIPVKTEKSRLASNRLRPGMTVWEFNLETHKGTPVQYKITEATTTKLGIQLRHQIEYRKDRYYCQALNLKNAIRKYKKWFILNQKMRMLIKASSPPPTSE